MEFPSLLVLLVILALLFDFTNGFHDAANAIATIVATKAMSLPSALLMSALCNLVGAFVATGVAQTIEHGLIREVPDPHLAVMVLLSALVGAIAWNVITWWFGMPSSSSHALIGGLVGAGWVYGRAEEIIWSGVGQKVVLPMLISPVMAGLVAIAWLAVIQKISKLFAADRLQEILPKLQIAVGGLMAFSHGSNDAQKSMGVITLALIGACVAPAESATPRWVAVSCALAIAVGTYAGGKRIIETVGEKICPLDPVSGFVGNSASALTVLAGSVLGLPLSTTHVVIGGVTGAGFGRSRQINWLTWRNMGLAWLTTLPGSALISGGMFALLSAVLL